MTRTAFDGPHAWKSDALWEVEGRLVQFSKDQAQQLKERALRLANDQALPLPDWALAILHRVRVELEQGSGVVRIRGLDLTGLSQRANQSLFWKICQALGTPVSQSVHGERLFQVRDQGLTTRDQRARGPNTRQSLSFHTDRCDVIAFCCVHQADHGGENMVASSAAIHNQILRQRPDLLDVLYRPFYWLRHNVDSGNRRAWCRLPVFAPYQGRFMANIMRVLIERGHKQAQLPDLTAEQRAALDLFEDTARRPDIHVRFMQQPGDLLFLNNFTVVHARSEFRDHPDGRDRRLLMRVWLSMPNSRELDPVFSQLYGATAAGALRGGIHPPKQAAALDGSGT